MYLIPAQMEYLREQPVVSLADTFQSQTFIADIFQQRPAFEEIARFSGALICLHVTCGLKFTTFPRDAIPRASSTAHSWLKAAVVTTEPTIRCFMSVTGCPLFCTG